MSGIDTSHQYECSGPPNDDLRIVHVPQQATYGIIPGVIWCWSHGSWEPIPEAWFTEEKRLREEIVTEWLAIRRDSSMIFRSDTLVDLIEQYRKFRFWRPVDTDDRHDVYRFMSDLRRYAPAIK